MTAKYSIGSHDDASPDILVLTRQMLRDILIAEGISRKTAEILALRISMCLPDLPSIVSQIENSVTNQFLATLESELVEEAMSKLHQRSKTKGRQIFEKIDEDLCQRIEKRASALMKTDDETLMEHARDFEFSILRANRPQTASAKDGVLVLTSESRTTGRKNA